MKTPPPDAIPLLVAIPLDDERRTRLGEAGFQLVHAPDGEARAAAIARVGTGVRAVLTHGSAGLTAAEIAGLPALEIICVLGAGYEHVDLVAARARRIVVSHGPGTNSVVVADHAMALLLAIVRDVVRLDHTVRRGGWRETAAGNRSTVSGKRLGVLGLGLIGREIAARGAGGFAMEVGYHSRHRVADVGYAYFASPVALARWADYLVIATPGGLVTRGLVDATVIEALGPDGFLVNIARGSVVDTEALIDALRSRRLAGAALDVVDGEPVVPAELTELDNVILTPHVAGRSPESMDAMIELVIANLRAHFDGEPVLTPVP